MSGIVFYGTKDLPGIKDFYLSRVGMKLWLEQADCVILKHGNLLLGFCQREDCEKAGIITLFYRTKEEVDLLHGQLGDRALEEPLEAPKYGIYRFFATDPENRTLEFQSFLHPVATYVDGEELLGSRRSVRNFTEQEVPDSLLDEVFELCRFAPTSMNTESYYFVVTRDRKRMETLGSLRGQASSPIARGPLAVAICSDPKLSRRHVQDGCIGAYHFILACWHHGLGTCWIAAMDRGEVKEILGIPEDHYVATVTPVGFPSKISEAPRRRAAKEMVRFVE